MHKHVLTFAAAFIGAAATACMPAGKDVTQPGDPVVATVVVNPSTATVEQGTTVALTAEARDALGVTIAGQPVSWSSSDDAIAPVGNSGVVSASNVGDATITATSGGQVGHSKVTVIPRRVASVVIVPTTATIVTGNTVQLTATTRDASGATLAGRAINWSSSNTSFASVSGDGLVTGVAPGAVTITASSEGKSGTATITVNAAPPVPVATVSVSPATSTMTVGATVQLTPTMRDANGATLSGRSVSWSSSNTGYATVSSSGLVTAVAAGAVTITATSEGKSGTATVTVNAPTPVPVASVSVTPATSTLNVGATVQLSATMRDANGGALSGRVVTWSSSNTGYAKVSSSGLVTGVAAGAVTITATSEGKSGTASITVNAPPPAPVATVAVSPSSNTINAGQTVQLAATARDANGATLTGRTITWSSSNASVASVSGNGLVTGIAAGTVTITATSETKSGTASVTVQSVTPPTKVDTIFAEGFESGSLSRWDDEGAENTHRVTTDPSHVHNGTHALEIDYPAGAEAGWLTKFFMPGYDSVYVRAWAFFPNGWDDQTKLIGLGGSRTDNAYSAMGKAGVCPNGTDYFNTMLVTPPGQDLGPTEFYTYYPGMPVQNGVCWGSDGLSAGAHYTSARTLATGSWHRIEFWVKINTPGGANGLQRYWIDGQLAGEWLNINYRASTILKLNSLMLTFSRSPGGAVAQSAYWDDILITTAPVP
jgi:uncharacterized protein YjdB